jgi:phenylpropionate dioxygenase-like ring-hydroxylating dioxygenase large terminal subunit
VALRNTWFPVAHLRQIGRRALQRAVHESPVVLWREGGRVHAAEVDLRRPRLGRHQFSELTGGTGRYALVERYGYAWIWYGEQDRADPALVPDVPFLPEDGDLPRHFRGTYVFDCTYELSCENLIDSTHADFVHSKLMGDPMGEDDRVWAESTSETVTMFREAKGRRTPKSQQMLVKSEKQDLLVVVHVHLRSGVMLNLGAFDPPGMRVNLFHPVVPESPARTRLNYMFNVRPGDTVAAPLVRQLFPLMGHAVSRQDNRVVRAQNANYLVASERADLSSRFDTPGLEYRKRMKALVNRQLRGDFSYLSDGDPGRDMNALFHY